MSRAMRRPVPLVGRTGRDEGESLRIGDAVNIEVDVLAKYAERLAAFITHQPETK